MHPIDTLKYNLVYKNQLPCVCHAKTQKQLYRFELLLLFFMFCSSYIEGRFRKQKKKIRKNSMSPWKNQKNRVTTF